MNADRLASGATRKADIFPYGRYTAKPSGAKWRTGGKQQAIVDRLSAGIFTAIKSRQTRWYKPPDRWERGFRVRWRRVVLPLAANAIFSQQNERQRTVGDSSNLGSSINGGRLDGGGNYRNIRRTA